MKIGIRGRFLLGAFTVIVLTMVAADILATRRVARAVTGLTRDDLAVRVALLEREASGSGFDLADRTAWDALADSLGRSARARVTLIRRDGTVIGDSEVDVDRLASVGNHAERPEVVESLSRGLGSNVRWSGTLQESMMYVAMPFRRGGEIVGVVRVALPLASVGRAVDSFRRMILLASLAALGLAALISGAAATWLSRPIRAVTARARRMAAGDLEARCEVAGRDEIAELARTLNGLAGNLSGSLAQLREKSALQERILLNAREGILMLDGSGRVAALNPALREMLLLGEQSVGLPVLEVVRNAGLHGLFNRARETGEAQMAEISIEGLKPRRLLAQVAPLPGEGGGLLGAFMDVTETRRLETVRRDFVANVSHELRTPIAAIASAVETLRHGARDDPAAAGVFIEMIERNAARMRDLVDDLLDLARIEARDFSLAVGPVDVAAAAAHALAAARSHADLKSIRLASEIPAGLPPAAADRRALDQILANLVDNAVKYSGQEAAVTVRAAESAGGIAISVEDTGPGIEAEHLPRLFERFYRTDAGRSRDLGGTGLGLSIVKHLAEAMKGTVGVESAPGAGSRFTVVLPRA